MGPRLLRRAVADLVYRCSLPCRAPNCSVADELQRMTVQFVQVRAACAGRHAPAGHVYQSCAHVRTGGMALCAECGRNVPAGQRGAVFVTAQPECLHRRL